MPEQFHDRTTTIVDVDYTGRRLEGLAFRWEDPATVIDRSGMSYLEEFATTAADRTLSHRPTLAVGILHPWSPGARTSPVPVGAVTFSRSAEGLAFSAVMSKGAAGEDALELVQIGALKDVSVSFHSIRTGKRPSARGIVTRREEIALRELSLAPPGMGQHPGAEVAAIRSTPTELVEGTPRLEQLRRRRTLIL